MSESKSVFKTGQVKWFNNKKGYGFITDLDDARDVFVHHSGLHVGSEVYRTLHQGEYVEFQDSTDPTGKQCAVGVQGIRGGSLMCEVQVRVPRGEAPTSQ